MDDVAGDWSQGKAKFEEICRIIEARPQRVPRAISTPTATEATLALGTPDAEELPCESQAQAETPKEWRPNPYLDDVLKTPSHRIPSNPAGMPIPAAVSGRDEPTPSPFPSIT